MSLTIISTSPPKLSGFPIRKYSNSDSTYIGQRPVDKTITREEFYSSPSHVDRLRLLLDRNRPAKVGSTPQGYGSFAIVKVNFKTGTILLHKPSDKFYNYIANISDIIDSHRIMQNVSVQHVFVIPASKIAVHELRQKPPGPPQQLGWVSK